MLLGASSVPAQNAPEAPEPAKTLLVDTVGFRRVHYTHRPPLIHDADGLKPLLFKYDLWMNRETPPVPGGWQTCDFDDHAWRRLPGTPFPVQRFSWEKLPDLNFGFSDLDMSSPYLSHLATRDRFLVADPSKVKGLTLSVGYRGGVVVYLNGKEVARRHMPPGEVTPETLATDYPVEAFATPDGGPLTGYKEIKPHRDRVEMHNRELADVKIPGTLLRKGVNVLALSVHRAPYHRIVREHQKPGASFVLTWSTCGLLRVRLEAEDASGAAPNVQRPKGVQVWNSPPMAVDFDLDWGDPSEPPRPIRLVGTRNGVFSGKVVVGSDEPIKGLAARAGALTSKRGGTIPASRVRVRYAFPSRSEEAASFRYGAVPTAFDGLEETPPDEVPVRVRPTGRYTWPLPGQPKCIYGAVAPVWVTVSVPADASPGDYTGTLTIDVGGRTWTVPVELAVSAYALPDPKDFVTFTELVQSPESVAMHYGVPFWSEKHFRLLAKSLSLLGEVGSWTTYLPLIAKTNMGNDESMVRWLKQPDGSFRHDFSVLERYLDLVVRHQGRPKVVCVYVWDYHADGETVPVTGVDAGGEPVTIDVPGYAAAGARALWQPVMDGVRERLKARGLEQAMTFGLGGDQIPTGEIVEFFKGLSPGTPWMVASHGSAADRLSKQVPLACCIDVWHTNFGTDPEEGRLHGWNLGELKMHFGRNIRDHTHLQTWRFLAPINIMGKSRGFARHGADFWPVLKDKKGNVTGRLGERCNSWRNLDIRDTVLAPGREGAVATHRFEMIREGIQETEARIVIDRALVEKKITGAFAARAQDLLDEHARMILRGAHSLVLSQGTWREHPVNPHQWWQSASEVGYQWYVSSPWQDMTGRLFDMAAEVQRAR